MKNLVRLIVMLATAVMVIPLHAQVVIPAPPDGTTAPIIVIDQWQERFCEEVSGETVCKSSHVHGNMMLPAMHMEIGPDTVIPVKVQIIGFNVDTSKAMMLVLNQTTIPITGLKETDPNVVESDWMESFVTASDYEFQGPDFITLRAVATVPNGVKMTSNARVPVDIIDPSKRPASERRGGGKERHVLTCNGKADPTPFSYTIIRVIPQDGDDGHLPRFINEPYTVWFELGRALQSARVTSQPIVTESTGKVVIDPNSHIGIPGVMVLEPTTSTLGSPVYAVTIDPRPKSMMAPNGLGLADGMHTMLGATETVGELAAQTSVCGWRFSSSLDMTMKAGNGG